MMTCKRCGKPIEDEATARFAQEPITSRAVDGEQVAFDTPSPFHPDCLKPFMRTHGGWLEGSDH